MASLFGAAAIPFIACIALLAAETLQILSFAAPYWATSEVTGTSFGLWRKARCATEYVGCTRWDFPWYVPDWQNAVRGLESCAIILIAIPLIVLPVYIYVALGLYYRCIMVFMTVCSLLAVLCNAIGVAIYGVEIGKSDELKVSWCLIVSIIGAGFDLIGFLILLIATINKPVFRPDKYYPSGFYVDPDHNKLYAVDILEKDGGKSTGRDNPVLVADD
ncbi:uncharacterized protein LOC121371619 [Gigantopelta aegis]|uniref:uncharacterized protein LOC121371619 n=1 Tax=Gigantopelta aegis TaxID=1735272 RepID=UPI001B88B830|nr:uncharacterized protein LOC121371619 [Gigantopelta aegis]